MSKRNDLLELQVTDEQLVITIGLDALVSITNMQPCWPLNEDGEPLKIIDRELFIKDFLAELGREDEDGTNHIHRAFDQSAIDLFENGSESVEME